MRVAKYQNFSLRINPNDHVPPRCHVRFRDQSEVRVQIPEVSPMDGDTITQEVAAAIIEHIEELVNAWETYHQPKNFKKDKIK